jgi:hypothetical protein
MVKLSGSNFDFYVALPTITPNRWDHDPSALSRESPRLLPYLTRKRLITATGGRFSKNVGNNQ